jgi:hypothetical protein
MERFKIGFARFPGDGTERKETVGWMMRTIRQMDKDHRISDVVPICITDTPVTMSRNRAVVEAQQADCDYLLMIDSDMVPDLPIPGAKPFWPTAWEFMLKRRTLDDSLSYEADYDASSAFELINMGYWMKCSGYTWRNVLRPDSDVIDGEYFAMGDYPDCVRSCPAHTLDDVAAISGDSRIWKKWHEPRVSPPALPPATIAAPYCGPPPEECVYVFHWAAPQSDDPNKPFRLEMYPREHAAIMGGIQEAAALPTGLILYDMRVFERLPAPWFDYEWTCEKRIQRASTEDVYQTRNASLLGLPQYCAWDSWAGHYKGKVVGKPSIITVDQVHASLRDAVLRGIESTDRIITLEQPA